MRVTYKAAGWILSNPPLLWLVFIVFTSVLACIVSEHDKTAFFSIRTQQYLTFTCLLYILAADELCMGANQLQQLGPRLVVHRPTFPIVAVVKAKEPHRPLPFLPSIPGMITFAWQSCGRRCECLWRRPVLEERVGLSQRRNGEAADPRQKLLV